jgi:hypothetical protein
MRTVRAGRIEVQRIAAEAAALDDRDAWQHLCQSTHHGRLGSALLATHQYAAHLRGHGGQDQGECHVIGTDDCGERKRTHLTPFLRVSTPAACLGSAGVRGTRR